ncbi:hypothetical protein QEH59_01830 [Coraliomargarita sp. SDUM461004]|uniref:Uncharacterized protein n=1 Tax=Thalassobacterium sedimentorum TaxID=3041258 RepID=A0ABU1AET1_9BACT|nr:hypothetical protein [Coraliomargarita sp. SDUM461004]MDQ8193147.1 hypothetical protein [Coraliomargarita sp. SDUM461004]
MSTPHSSRRAWHPLIAPAMAALSTYWPAILLIQFAALTVVLAYYFIDGTAGLFATIAGWKQSGGLYFAAGSTIVSGGILPELIKRRFRPPEVSAPGIGELCHQFTMWATLGIVVDLMYRLQSLYFGNGTDPATLLTKVFVDQFIFTPLISLPCITLWFALREVHYAPRAFVAYLRFRTLLNRVLPLWTTSLCFWPVMLCIVFSLPAPLQFPLFLLGNAAFSILMIFIVRHQTHCE